MDTTIQIGISRRVIVYFTPLNASEGSESPQQLTDNSGCQIDFATFLRARGVRWSVSMRLVPKHYPAYFGLIGLPCISYGPVVKYSQFFVTKVLTWTDLQLTDFAISVSVNSFAKVIGLLLSLALIYPEKHERVDRRLLG
jgi:hypothetical protein